MSEIDYFGHEGGRMAMAFAAGCVAAFGFLSTVGGFIWSFIDKARQDRIDELCKELMDERKRCDAMEDRLVRRIEQLETILMMGSSGKDRAAVATHEIGEARAEYAESKAAGVPAAIEDDHNGA